MSPRRHMKALSAFYEVNRKTAQMKKKKINAEVLKIKKISKVGVVPKNLAKTTKVVRGSGKETNGASNRASVLASLDDTVPLVKAVPTKKAKTTKVVRGSGKETNGASNWASVLASLDDTVPLVKAVPTKKAKTTKIVRVNGKQRFRFARKLKSPYSSRNQAVVQKDKDLNVGIDAKLDTEDASPFDSVEEGRKLFTWLIEPIDPDEFFGNTWEKRPLHVKRHFPEYYAAVLSTQMMDNILRSNFIQFTVNVDVTSYRNGKRETHNPPGRALPSVVWSYYNKGCSVRMLNPQTFSPKLGLLSATLQEYLGCFVGANSYLTPPDSQGFAPHYDDIEAFILQLEGKKNWKLYAPRSSEETLPRYSSGNFSQDEIGEPIMEVTLCPGDLLYFPRGTIHQASTVPGHHSLHVTLSCYQHNSWGDFMEKLLPATLTVAMEEDVEFRKGLPRDYLRHLGIAHSDLDTPERAEFFQHLQLLLGRLYQYLPVDAAADQMGKQFLHDALPPVLSLEERQCSSFDGAEKLDADGKIITCKEIHADTNIKLLRAHILRLVKDGDLETVQVYHCINNTLEYHAVEPQSFDISSDFAPGIEFLIHSYPKFVAVQEIPLESMEMRLQVATELWKRGLLQTEKSLTSDGAH